LAVTAKEEPTRKKEKACDSKQPKRILQTPKGKKTKEVVERLSKPLPKPITKSGTSWAEKRLGRRRKRRGDEGTVLEGTTKHKERHQLLTPGKKGVLKKWGKGEHGIK